MFNPMNNVQLIGRLAQEVKVFERTDGSKSLIGKVAVNDNYKSGGEFGTEFLEFTMYVPAGQKNWAEELKVGDDIIVVGHLTAKPYEKDGEKVYPAMTFAADRVVPNGYGRKAKKEAPAEEEAEA